MCTGIASGCFPDILKIAEIIPVYKAGAKNICSNYRPISIINPFSKIFEKCLYKPTQLYNYFTTNQLLNKNQYGFLNHSSTSDAEIDAYNEILLNLDQKKTTISLFLDLSKAFDCINHDILIKKLEKYGIRSLPLKLLESYLTNRLQYTNVNNIPSDTNKITCGVPQVSKLSALLFIIYVNDMPRSTKINVRLFADDTNLTINHQKSNDLEKMANNELKQISNWMKLTEVESSRTSLASRTSSRTDFEVLGLGLGLEGQVLGLGLETSSPRKLACPRLEDSSIF